MFIKNSKHYDALVQVFDYEGYSLYFYKSRSQFRKKLDLKSRGKERLVFSLKGPIQVNGETLAEKDMMYLGLDSDIELNSPGESVVFVAETDAMTKYDSYIRKYKDASRMKIGQPTFRRTVVVTIGEKDPANKFIAGYVEDSLGEWSSYPPHKHDDKPEAYVYYGVNPGFAIQVIIDGENESAYVVHDYDTVLFPKGYHPHVNTSLTGSNYAWIISAPPNNRNLAVDIHPAFKNVNLGPSHLSVKSDS